jgi:peptidoglycan biosynthesis protein MviN/MurJ (putative lipid II flippase)
VPLAIIGVSYSVAAFPILAELVSKQDFISVRLHINSALRHIIFWSVPAIVLIVVLRAQIVRVVLGAGSFNWDDTRLTAAILAILSLSLVAQAINLLFIRALYAGGYTRSPLLIAFLGLFVAGAASFIGHDLYNNVPAFRDAIETLFRVRGVPGTEALVIGTAFTISVLVQTLLLCLMVRSAFTLSLSWLPQRLVKASVASIVGGVFVYMVINIVALGIDETTFIGIMIQGVLGGVTGLSVIGFMYYVLKMPDP